MTPAPDQIQCEDKSPAVVTQFKGAFLEELSERAAGLKATCKAANMVVRRALEASEQPPLSDAATTIHCNVTSARLPQLMNHYQLCEALSQEKPVRLLSDYW